MAHRVRPAPIISAPKSPPPPPNGKGGVIWNRMLDAAIRSGHPEPERMADAMLRSREKALALNAARPKTLVTTHAPKPSEVAAVAAKSRPLKNGAKCKALTLEGRPCPFKAIIGFFCKKHKVVEKI